MTRKGIRLFWAYVKENIGGIALAICAALMLTALFYLYELPKEPLIYALALVGAIALLPFLLKYAYIKKRHTELEAILNNIAQVLGELPPPYGVLEHDYSDMLKKLDEARNRLTGEYEKEIGDMLEQYTLWAHQIKTPIAAMRLLIQSNASSRGDEYKESQAHICSVCRGVCRSHGDALYNTVSFEQQRASFQNSSPGAFDGNCRNNNIFRDSYALCQQLRHEAAPA